MPRLSRYKVFQTSDIDAARQFMQAQMKRQIELVDGRRFNFRMAVAPLPVMLICATDSSSLKSTTHGAADLYTLCRMQSGEWDRRDASQRNVIAAGSGILIPPGVGSISRLTGPSATFSSTALCIPAGLFALEAERLIGEPPKHALELMEIENLRTSYLGESLDFMFEELNLPNNRLEKHSVYSLEFQKRLISYLIEFYPHSYRNLLLRRHGGSHARYIAKAEEYAATHLTEPFGMAELSVAAGCNARTLREAFKKRHQKPMQIKWEMRAHAIRKRLEDPRPEETAESICDEYGFNYHRLCILYESLFHETPGETLKRGRRKVGLRFVSSSGPERS